MYFINRNRKAVIISLLSCFHPRRITPSEFRDICDPGCGSRTLLCIICKWIGFVKSSAIFCFDEEFIEHTHFCSDYKTFIDTGRLKACHQICLFSPAVKFTDHADSSCIRCPDCKINTFFAIHHCFMCTHFFINIIMRSHTEQILIQFSDTEIFLCCSLCSRCSFRCCFCCCFCCCSLCCIRCRFPGCLSYLSFCHNYLRLFLYISTIN